MIDWELPTSATRPRTSAGSASAPGASATTSCRSAGVGELEPFLAAYEAAGGDRPDPERLRFWEAFGNVKWAVICARQAHDHLTGAAAKPRARLARAADLRARVGHAGADRAR